MVEHCPVVKTMRALRKEYRIGIEFTDWPTRPKANPIKGPILPDVRVPICTDHPQHRHMNFALRF